MTQRNSPNYERRDEIPTFYKEQMNQTGSHYEKLQLQKEIEQLRLERAYLEKESNENINYRKRPRFGIKGLYLEKKIYTINSGDKWYKLKKEKKYKNYKLDYNINRNFHLGRKAYNIKIFLENRNINLNLKILSKNKVKIIGNNKNFTIPIEYKNRYTPYIKIKIDSNNKVIIFLKLPKTHNNNNNNNNKNNHNSRRNRH